MRIVDRRRCRCPVDTEAQLIDPLRSESRPVLYSAILIPRQVKRREPRHIRARRRPDVWNQSGTVVYGVAREQRMGAGEVVVDANYTVVLTSVAFISRNEFACPIPIAWSVRRRHQIQELLYQRIDRNGDTSAWSGVGAGGRITSGWQQSLMGESIWHRCNCRGCLHLAKPLIVDKKECVIALQRPTDSGAELIADELRDRIAAQIEVVLSVK